MATASLPSFGLNKQATHDGGDSVPFESALANICLTQLQDRAPRLMPYLLGSQLVEKNDKNDRAVMVMGFQVGDQLFMAPRFFLSGKVKGQELLFDVKHNMFFPLKDDMVDWLIQRGGSKSMGEGVPKSTRTMGVEYPTLSAFSEIPGKYASDHGWVQEGMPGLAYAACHYKSPEPVTPRLIKESAEFAGKLLQLVDYYPQTFKPIVDCFGPQVIRDAMETVKNASTIMSNVFRPRHTRTLRGSIFSAKEACDRYNPEKLGQLKIHVYNGKKPEGITEKQAEDLLREGFVVHDTRPEKSRLFGIRGPIILDSPTETGIYSLLTRPGDFQKCVIFCGTIDGDGVQPGALVIRADNDGKINKSWTKRSTAELCVDSIAKPKDLQEWIAKLPKAESLEKGCQYILVTDEGVATGVFEVEETMPSSDGDRAYGVNWRHSYCGRRPGCLGKLKPRYDRSHSIDAGTPMVVLGRPVGTTLVNLSGTVYAPEGVRVLKVKGRDKWYTNRPMSSADEQEDPIRPGNNVDIQLGLSKSASEMKIFSDGYEIIVNDRRFQPQAALFHLIRDHGLEEKTARDAIRQGELQRGARFFVKYAGPYYELQHTAPSAPAMPDPPTGTDDFFQSGLPTTPPIEYNEPVSGLQTLRPGQMNMAAPPEPQLMQNIMQASQSGQKEIMDTSMLNGLLKGTQDETIIDKYLKPIAEGMDADGRLYFNLLWHGDMFENRYGSDKMPELEDSLRNHFDASGDLLMTLNKKKMDLYPGEGLENNLEEAAEV